MVKTASLYDNFCKTGNYVIYDVIIWVQNENSKKLECGPMPNVMVALSNTGGALCSTRKVWLTSTTRVPCSNAAKTRNPLKFAGVIQTNETISAASGPKITILWEHVEELLLLNKFFSNCRYIP